MIRKQFHVPNNNGLEFHEPGNNPASLLAACCRSDAPRFEFGDGDKTRWLLVAKSLQSSTIKGSKPAELEF